MAFLLDSHVVVWALTEPDRLSAAALEIIQEPRQRLMVSAATIWELSVKNRLGKLPQADALLSRYERHLDRLGVEPLPITAAHGHLAGQLDWEHRDPFDRMLAAQCLYEDLTLISRDAVFPNLPGLPVVW